MYLCTSQFLKFPLRKPLFLNYGTFLIMFQIFLSLAILGRY